MLALGIPPVLPMGDSIQLQPIYRVCLLNVRVRGYVLDAALTGSIDPGRLALACDPCHSGAK